MEMLTNSLRISPQYAVFCRHYFTRKRIIVTSFFVLSGALSWEPQESISPKTFNQHKHVTYDVSSNNYRPNDSSRDRLAVWQQEMAYVTSKFTLQGLI